MIFPFNLSDFDKHGLLGIQTDRTTISFLFTIQITNVSEYLIELLGY